MQFAQRTAAFASLQQALDVEQQRRRMPRSALLGRLDGAQGAGNIALQLQRAAQQNMPLGPRRAPQRELARGKLSGAPLPAAQQGLYVIQRGGVRIHSRAQNL